MKDSHSHQVTGQRGISIRIACAIFLSFVVAPVHAGVLSISFSALVEADDGSGSQFASGSFLLDNSRPFEVGAGFLDGLILAASFESEDLVVEGDIEDPFTSVVAGDVPGIGGVVDLFSRFPNGEGLFWLELVTPMLMAGDSVFDVLMSGLALDDLTPFDASAGFSTQFGYVRNDTGVFYEGGLTSLSVTEVSEPGTLLLLVFALPIFCAGVVKSRNRRTID